MAGISLEEFEKFCSAPIEQVVANPSGRTTRRTSIADKRFAGIMQTWGQREELSTRRQRVTLPDGTVQWV